MSIRQPENFDHFEQQLPSSPEEDRRARAAVVLLAALRY